MEPLPYGYKMGDEICSILVSWSTKTPGCICKELEQESLIQDRWKMGTNGGYKLTGKGGRLLKAITANMMTYYLNNNW